MSIKGEILTALKNRLATVTIANGYPFTLRKLFYDKIPMGINLENHELPALFILDGPTNYDLEHSCLKGFWEIRLQLWDREGKGDVAMCDLTATIFRAIYANSPTAEVTTEFRSIHPSIVEVIPRMVSPDLNLIAANRVYEISLVIHYRTKLFNM